LPSGSAIFAVRPPHGSVFGGTSTRTSAATSVASVDELRLARVEDREIAAGGDFRKFQARAVEAPRGLEIADGHDDLFDRPDDGHQ
jgi:hypothetical protein